MTDPAAPADRFASGDPWLDTIDAGPPPEVPFEPVTWRRLTHDEIASPEPVADPYDIDDVMEVAGDIDGHRERLNRRLDAMGEPESHEVELPWIHAEELLDDVEELRERAVPTNDDDLLIDLRDGAQDGADDHEPFTVPFPGRAIMRP